MGIRWPGATVAILASGPSMSAEQAEIVRVWRDAAPDRKVIAINTTFLRAPWADVLYACDVTWWEHYHAEVGKIFKGELWSQDRKARDKFGIRWIESAPKAGLGKAPALIHQGQNSGYQAINLAYQAGAKRMFLLGFDMKGSHWHGEHPLPLTNPKPYLFDSYRSNFVQMANDLRTAGIEVINCTPDSALTVFTQVPLWEFMAGEALRMGNEAGP
jgi:hypothetical protein